MQLLVHSISGCPFHIHPTNHRPVAIVTSRPSKNVIPRRRPVDWAAARVVRRPLRMNSRTTAALTGAERR